MSQAAIKREDIVEALAENEARRAEYLNDGGEETSYLDGKIAALEELLAAIDAVKR